MNTIPAIGYDLETLKQQAVILAERYGFVIDNQTLPRLNVTPQQLVLLTEGFTPLTIDFNHAQWQKRRAAGKKQGLIRACKPTQGLRILDVTAGWGRDAAVLASFGAQVLMLERQPIMTALLEDALNRCHAANMSLALLHTDAKTYLQHLTPQDYPDVIYIDPMHPERQKSALVKKDMQILQQLFGPDIDAQALLQLALTRARKRIVVKWPSKEKPLLKPDFIVLGKTVRFDVYHCS
jgi:16S rRNA (guanine1516-N2)-methyltransferase